VRPSRAHGESSGGFLFARILTILGLVLGGAALFSGREYYVTRLTERPFSPLHELYAPTGLIGHGFGIIGSLMVIVGVALYSGRKRIPFLARVGKLRGWLQLHIFLCLLGPFLILLHTTFKFGGFVAISFWSMTLVVGSGVFGRYVYVWIPKTMNGRFLEAKEVREQLHQLLEAVAQKTSLSADQLYAILRPETATDGPRGPRRQEATVASRAPHPAPSPSRGPGPAITASEQPRPESGGHPEPRRTGLAASVEALFAARSTATADATARPARPEPASARLGAESHGARAPARPAPDRRARPRPGPDRRRTARAQLGLAGAIASSIRYRMGRGRARKRFQRELRAAGVNEPILSRIVADFEEETRIEQQLRTLQPFQRAFRYWHAFHLPLAAVMFVVLFGHVAVAIAFGYTWIF